MSQDHLTTEQHVGLLPAENIALTVALAQWKRGDPIQPNTGAMCMLALARVTGRFDWTQSDCAMPPVTS